MGHVAATAAGNLNFGQHLPALFKDRHAGMGRTFRTRDGAEETGGPAADHNDVKIVHSGPAIRT
jgi:hypothetical protein